MEGAETSQEQQPVREVQFCWYQATQSSLFPGHRANEAYGSLDSLRGVVQRSVHPGARLERYLVGRIQGLYNIQIMLSES